MKGIYFRFPTSYSLWLARTQGGHATATAPKVQDTKVPWSRGTGPKWRGDLVTYG